MRREEKIAIVLLTSITLACGKSHNKGGDIEGVRGEKPSVSGGKPLSGGDRWEACCRLSWESWLGVPCPQTFDTQEACEGWATAEGQVCMTPCERYESPGTVQSAAPTSPPREDSAGSSDGDVISCDAFPPSSDVCVDGYTLRTSIPGAGVFHDGTCEYPIVVTHCPYGCRNARCLDFSCVPQTCESRDAHCGTLIDACSGSVLNCGLCSVDEACLNFQCVYTGTHTSQPGEETAECNWDGVCQRDAEAVWCSDCCDRDGVCEIGELSSCQDCQFCGDGSCNAAEDSESCRIDCPVCGDGLCGYHETASCPGDCQWRLDLSGTDVAWLSFTGLSCAGGVVISPLTGGLSLIIVAAPMCGVFVSEVAETVVLNGMDEIARTAATPSERQFWSSVRLVAGGVIVTTNIAILRTLPPNTHTDAVLLDFLTEGLAEELGVLADTLQLAEIMTDERYAYYRATATVEHPVEGEIGRAEFILARENCISDCVSGESYCPYLASHPEIVSCEQVGPGCWQMAPGTCQDGAMCDSERSVCVCAPNVRTVCGIDPMLVWQLDSCGNNSGPPVRCATPSPSRCVDSRTLRVFSPTGLCVEGACAYEYWDITCEFGCDAIRGQCRACTPLCRERVCGPDPTGCGVTCGSCDADEICENGTCVAICIPETCADLNATCGSVIEQCGNELHCGTCVSGERCESGQCACAPETCTEIGSECGAAIDRCGNVLECESCPTAWRCEQGRCAPANTDIPEPLPSEPPASDHTIPPPTPPPPTPESVPECMDGAIAYSSGAYAEIPALFGEAKVETLTIEASVKMTPDAGCPGVMVSKQAHQKFVRLEVCGAEQRIRFTFRTYPDGHFSGNEGPMNNGNPDTTFTSVVEGESPVLFDGQWHHIATTFDRGYLALFVDGIPIAHAQTRVRYVDFGRVPDNETAGVYGWGPFLAIGADRYGDTPSSFFNGTIDELRVSRVVRYRDVFTPMRRLALDSETEALWRFNELEGHAVLDVSENTRHGTLHGGMRVLGVNCGR